MTGIVGYGSLLPNGLCTGAEWRAPRDGEVGIINHPTPGGPWQQTLCDPTTCTIGGCAVGGPYHQIPHAGMVAKAQAAAAFEARVQAQMRAQAVAALAAQGIVAPT